MTPSEARGVRMMAEDIRQLRIWTGAGASEAHLRLAAGKLREISRDFHTAWRRLGLERSAVIPSRRLQELDGLVMAFDGSGMDTPPGAAGIQDFMGGGPILLSEGPDGKYRPVEEEVQQVGQIAQWHDPTGRTFGTPQEVFVESNLPVHEFWAGTVLLFQGRKIHRRHIIDFVANSRGGSHYDGGAVRKKDAEILATLEAFSAGPTLSGRESVFYLAMSIGQDFAAAPDVHRFLSEADKLPTPLRR